MWNNITLKEMLSILDSLWPVVNQCLWVCCTHTVTCMLWLDCGYDVYLLHYTETTSFSVAKFKNSFVCDRFQHATQELVDFWGFLLSVLEMIPTPVVEQSHNPLCASVSMGIETSVIGSWLLFVLRQRELAWNGTFFCNAKASGIYLVVATFWGNSRIFIHVDINIIPRLREAFKNIQDEKQKEMYTLTRQLTWNQNGLKQWHVTFSIWFCCSKVLIQLFVHFGGYSLWFRWLHLNYTARCFFYFVLPNCINESRLSNKNTFLFFFPFHHKKYIQVQLPRPLGGMFLSRRPPQTQRGDWAVINTIQRVECTLNGTCTHF